MLKRARLYAAVTLVVQSITFMFLVLIFLFKNKRNTASAFCVMGIAGGIVGSVLLAKQFREEFKDKDILSAIDELCESTAPETAAVSEIPVDDTADETEFN